MPARGAAAPSLHMQVIQLRELLQDLLPDQGPHTPSDAAQGGALPLRRLLSDVPFTLEVALSAVQLARAFIGRPERERSVAPPSRVGRRRVGMAWWLLRHPFVAVGIALGVGVAAYRLARGARVRLGSRVPTERARRADAAL